MNDAELEFAQDYLEKLKNTRRLIEAMRKDRNAPIDATRPLEGQLQAIQEKNMPRIIEILLKDAVDREQIVEPPTEIER